MKKMRFIQFAVIMTVCVSVMALFFACQADSEPQTETPIPPVIEGVEIGEQPAANVIADLFDTSKDFPTALSNSWKIWGHHNALITQGFGADPTALPYKDRLYIISSNDSLLYKTDGSVDIGGYNAGIQGIRVLSSADLANWTDHGLVNVGNLPTWTNPLYPMEDHPRVTPYDSKSWAPSAVWKNINGKDRFFIYFGDSGNGIGVISADSPTGPWTSPLTKLLIDRDTPNCATNEVQNLFDPGAFVDDDGWGYLYFGGGGGGDYGRRVRLGKDLISLDTEPERFTALNLFEDNEFTKIGEMYYYSYVNTGTSIAYMTSWEPMAALKDFTPSTPKVIMASPSNQLGTPNENNHHCIFTFKDEQYITYHASTVSQAMGVGDVKYRSTHIDKINVKSDGSIDTIKMTRNGVESIGNLDPYIINEAETIGIQGGVFTRPQASAGNGMVVTSIDSGDWVAVYEVDFGSSGAKKFIARVRMPDTPADYVGAIELRLDPEGDGEKTSLNATKTATITGGDVIGRVQIKGGNAGEYGKVTIDLDKTVTGIHDLVFIFYSSLGAKPIIHRSASTTENFKESHHKNGFEFDQWQFSK
jgi:arabinoxylan arabinofuranohydrolase